MAGFAKLHQNDGGDINRTLSVVSVFELPTSVFAQSLAVDINGPNQRVGISYSQRECLRIHELLVERIRFPFPKCIRISSYIRDGIIVSFDDSPAPNQLEVRCGMALACEGWRCRIAAPDNLKGLWFGWIAAQQPKSAWCGGIACMLILPSSLHWRDELHFLQRNLLSILPVDYR